jgi:hypothetical protein
MPPRTRSTSKPKNITMKKLLATAALALAAHLPASAALLVGQATAGASVVTDFSTDGLIAFDLDLADAQPVRLDFLLGAADVGGVLDLNAVLRNLTGVGLDRLHLSLSIGSFDAAGSVTRPFGGGATTVNIDGRLASLLFDGPEFLDIFIGNPFAEPGLADWRIDTRGLNAGDVLAITIAVPEPGAVALVLSALLALVAVRARRGRR